MSLRELVGLGVGTLALAGLTVVVLNGGNTANVITAITNGWANVVRASTGR